MKLSVYYGGINIGYVNSEDFESSFESNQALLYKNNGSIVFGGWSCANGWAMHFQGVTIKKIRCGKKVKYMLQCKDGLNSRSDMYLLYIGQDVSDPNYKEWYEPKVIIQENYSWAIKRLTEIETYAQGHEEVRYGYYFPETKEVYEKIKNDYMLKFPKNGEEDDIHTIFEVEVETKK